MRGDFQQGKFDTDGARTQSEFVQTQSMCGLNVLKVARYLNLIGGTALIVICVLEIINVFTVFFDLGSIFLNIYLCFFGLLIMGSSINMPCIGRNFFFLLTGVGKGVFNIFVGTLLFLNRPGSFSPSVVLAFCFIFSGLVFLSLSCCKKMTDDELQRATSLYGKELQIKARNEGKKFVSENKESIAKAAVDNKDVIASVAMDHHDSIVNAAFEDKRDMETSNYIRGQNN